MIYRTAPAPSLSPPVSGLILLLNAFFNSRDTEIKQMCSHTDYYPQRVEQEAREEE